MNNLSKEERMVILAMRRGWDVDLTLNSKPDSVRAELDSIKLPYDFDFQLEYNTSSSVAWWNIKVPHGILNPISLTVFDK